MEITSHIVDTPPRDAATVLMLREGEAGMEVLLLKRWLLCNKILTVFMRNWASPI
jgi:hypothetical protein